MLDETLPGEVRSVLNAAHQAAERATQQVQDIAALTRPLGRRLDERGAPVQADWLAALEAAPGGRRRRLSTADCG